MREREGFGFEKGPPTSIAVFGVYWVLSNLAQEVARGIERGRLPWLLDDHILSLRLLQSDGAGWGQEATQAGAGARHRRRGGAHVPDGGCRQEHPRHRQGPQRRGHCQLQGEALVQDRGPSHTHQRDLHGDIGVGPAGQGQGSSGEGGERLPRHRVQRASSAGWPSCCVLVPRPSPTPAGCPAPTC